MADASVEPKLELFTDRYKVENKDVRSRVCVASLLNGPYDLATKEAALTLLYRLLNPQSVGHVLRRKAFTFKAANVFYISADLRCLRNQSHSGWWYVILSGASSALTSRNWGQYFNSVGILNIAPKLGTPVISNNFIYYATLFLMPGINSVMLDSMVSYMKSWMCLDDKLIDNLQGNSLEWFLQACSDRGALDDENPMIAAQSVIPVAPHRKRMSRSAEASTTPKPRKSRKRLMQALDASQLQPHQPAVIGEDSSDGSGDGGGDGSLFGTMILPPLPQVTSGSITSASNQAFMAVGQKLLEFDQGLGGSLTAQDNMDSQSQQNDLQLPALTMYPDSFAAPDQTSARYPHNESLFTPSCAEDGLFPQTSFTPSYFDGQSYQSHNLEDECISYLAGFSDQPMTPSLVAAISNRFSNTVTSNGYGSVLSQLPHLQYIEGAVNLFQAFFALLQKKYALTFPNPLATMDAAEFDRLRTAGYDPRLCLEFQTLVGQMPGVFSSALPLLYHEHFLLLASLNIVYEHVTVTQGNAGASRASAFQDIARLTATNIAAIAAWIDSLARLSDIMVATPADACADPACMGLKHVVALVRPLRKIPDILAPLVGSASMKPEDVLRRIAVQSREVAMALGLQQISTRISQHIQTLQTMGSLMPGPLFDTPSITRFLPHTPFSLLAVDVHDDQCCANFIEAMTPLRRY